MELAERNALVIDNLPLARWLAARSSLEFDDACQEAGVAMLLCAEKYRTGKGCADRFGAYAAKCIHRRLVEVAYKTSYPVHVPPTAAKCVPHLRREIRIGIIDHEWWNNRNSREVALAAMRVLDSGRVDFEEWEASHSDRDDDGR